MYPSATLCRSQQAYHRERARTALLGNVRMVADKAALAWGIEATAAEIREARRIHTRLTADLIAAAKQEAAPSIEASPNENPDRGLADLQPAR